MKTSAVPADNQIIEALAIVFNSQHDIVPAFEAGKLNKDCVVVRCVSGAAGQRNAGTAQTMPPLGVLMDKGYRVAWSQTAVVRRIRQSAFRYSRYPGSVYRRAADQSATAI